MHAKVTVADDVVFVGSFNLSRSGEENAENVLEIADAALADRMAAWIDEQRARFEPVRPPRHVATAEAAPGTACRTGKGPAPARVSSEMPALALRDVRLLVTAVGLSAIGDFLVWVPLALHVEATTDSAFAVAAFFFALFGPSVALAGFAGRLADRVENARPARRGLARPGGRGRGARVLDRLARRDPRAERAARRRHRAEPAAGVGADPARPRARTSARPTASWRAPATRG